MPRLPEPSQAIFWADVPNLYAPERLQPYGRVGEHSAVFLKPAQGENAEQRLHELVDAALADGEVVVVLADAPNLAVHECGAHFRALPPAGQTWAQILGEAEHVAVRVEDGVLLIELDDELIEYARITPDEFRKRLSADEQEHPQMKTPDAPRLRSVPTGDKARELRAILAEVHDYLGRFVAYPSEHAHLAHCLWIAHAHAMDAWESTPRLAFLSPERGSGKSRALELSETLVPRPIETMNSTPAYLFRKISDPAGAPTVLFDEVDTIFGPAAREHEDLRAILNAGHRRGATAGRCVIKGKEILTIELPAYAAVALAGLGNLPDTITSRAVIVRMRRRAPGETVEPYRRRDHAPEGNALRDRMAAWATGALAELAAARPKMPQGVEDRDADVWEALLALADAAGGDWPERARDAAVELVAEAKDSAPSFGERLLADLRTIFADHEVLFTEEILRALIALDESPWGDLRGKPLDARRLARYLKAFGVVPKQVRVGMATQKGYAAEDLFDPWARYLKT